VRQGDVEEAMRLIHVSKISLLEDRQKGSAVDPISAIYEIVRALALQANNNNNNNNNRPSIQYADVVPRVVAKGYTQQQLEDCLNEYEKLSVWQISGNRQEIEFV
jgi:DNA replication licensing factor MCM7